MITITMPAALPLLGLSELCCKQIKPVQTRDWLLLQSLVTVQWDPLLQRGQLLLPPQSISDSPLSNFPSLHKSKFRPPLELDEDEKKDELLDELDDELLDELDEPLDEPDDEVFKDVDNNNKLLDDEDAVEDDELLDDEDSGEDDESLDDADDVVEDDDDAVEDESLDEEIKDEPLDDEENGEDELLDEETDDELVELVKFWADDWKIKPRLPNNKIPCRWLGMMAGVISKQFVLKNCNVLS